MSTSHEGRVTIVDGQIRVRLTPQFSPLLPGPPAEPGREAPNVANGTVVLLFEQHDGRYFWQLRLRYFQPAADLENFGGCYAVIDGPPGSMAIELGTVAGYEHRYFVTRLFPVPERAEQFVVFFVSLNADGHPNPTDGSPFVLVEISPEKALELAGNDSIHGLAADKITPGKIVFHTRPRGRWRDALIACLSAAALWSLMAFLWGVYVGSDARREIRLYVFDGPTTAGHFAVKSQVDREILHDAGDETFSMLENGYFVRSIPHPVKPIGRILDSNTMGLARVEIFRYE